jgi:hypothetical protein
MQHRGRRVPQDQALEVMAEFHFGLRSRFAVGASAHERWKDNEVVGWGVEIGSI